MARGGALVARRRAPLVLVPLLLVLLGAPPAFSQADPVRLDVRLGFDGVTRAYTPNPLEVVIESDELFAGSIRVETPSGGNVNTYEIPIEVPGGSRKAVRMVAPRATLISVRAVDRDGRIRAEVDSFGGRTLSSGEQLIGLLTPEPLDVTAVSITVLDRPLEVVRAPQELLDLGGGALSALSHLVLDGALGSRLSDRELDAVRAFVLDGGRLIVAAGAEPDLAFLPARWRGSGSGDVRRTDVGSGSVTVALRPMRDPGWLPTGSMWDRTVEPVDVMSWSAGTSLEGWANVLGEAGGFRRAAIGWLLGFILGYVLLVAPVNFLILSRIGRRELAWVTIPGLALVFAVGAFFAGSGLRSAATTRGVAVVELGPDGERTLTALGVLSRTGGVETLRLDGPWVVEGLPQFSGRNPETTTRLGRDTASTRFSLSVGDVGAITARRSRARTADGAGVVRLRNGTLRAELRNTAPFRLERPGVYVGGSFLPIDTPLRAGARTTLSVGVDRLTSDPVNPVYEQHYSSQTFGYTQPPVNTLQRAIASTGLADRGSAYLIGWADLQAAGTALGLPPARGIALVASRLTLDAGGAAVVPPDAVEGAIVGTDGQISEGDPFGGSGYIENGRSFTLRFRMPSGTTPARLRLRTDHATQFGPGIVVRRFSSSKTGASATVTTSTSLQPSRTIVGGGRQTGRAYAFDHASGRWVQIGRTSGRAVVLDAAPFLAPDGEVYIRIETDFAQIVTPGLFSLAGLAA